MEIEDADSEHRACLPGLTVPLTSFGEFAWKLARSLHPCIIIIINKVLTMQSGLTEIVEANQTELFFLLLPEMKRWTR
jgi:hypothetical protein